MKFKTVNCPRCNYPVEINIAKAVDELGEEFLCPRCKFIFRYVDKINKNGNYNIK